MRREGLLPRQTQDALRDDTRWARDKVDEIKEEMRHGR
jgi:hypothetical protein